MAMIENRRKKSLIALSMVTPFIVVFVTFFLYPLIEMVRISFTDAPLIGDGDWVGFANYAKLLGDRLFVTSLKNNGYFVLLTVVPTTVIALMIALAVSRLSGVKQTIAMSLFFLPYVLPVSVVTEIWAWMLDLQFGILQPVISLIAGKPVAVFKNPYWVMPMVAVVTIWWTNGFNVLLFIAGLRNIPTELYEAASLDGATTWQRFWRVTWPLLWPVTALILTLQLILQLKIFDQIYLLSGGGPFNSSFVLLLKVYREAFQLNNGGYASAVATVLFLLIVTVSILQFQLLRIRRNS
ncbi:MULTISPECIES: carbohydrate ABC transporter permease [Agrobacterium tumefaciens complex]|jgi:multiple sugar transport system permease protein|uniref:ABC transporter, membrane spanning protein (Sugar) n=2 Tax=Agrobacterium tumefaciens complex TaxID=1183400 RepID=A0A1S7R0A9_AGRTU|nr:MULTISPECIES: sugar ABC transporter permease [Agrobacterium tumefaciens complex]MCP2137641.1 multiple sugar transport system permease protein [Rhizobium sp. SLBN-94]AYM82905.1 multiple sugar transport system permease protein [Agrobacterium tumefaciens]EPR10277.1 sugar ABC transporter permease [Agrobacterium radiobacter DSM 30147]KWT79498.1 sugar ABC transporter permease [Agrobacterium radiobacter]MBB4284024.1 multiple sugar transport system permease protein [Agrobacterium radiobacter]